MPVATGIKRRQTARAWAINPTSLICVASSYPRRTSSTMHHFLTFYRYLFYWQLISKFETACNRHKIHCQAEEEAQIVKDNFELKCNVILAIL